MQTMIRIEKDVLKMLEKEKELGRDKSYNETIKKLLEQRKLSMFGADRHLNGWKESEDRAKFRN